MHRHSERRHMPYRAEQLFALVADVERYPEFLPWAVAARIRRRQGNLFWADLVIGFQMIRERFTSKVALTEPGRRIDVEYTDGPFRHLANHWIFRPLNDGCEVEFFVEFQFRNALFEKIMGALFDDAVRRMVNAFEQRAAALYGAGPAGGALPSPSADPA